ncbi:MAG: DNA-formamidopyrimidine glycosylase [Gammaproteobacteria bacterium]|nr:DNA-formamidopyrimidine glycosylase [Gammaproteobacteria bacterium]
MPELPEVETTRRGVTPHVVGRRVEQVKIYDRRLRWPVPDDYETTLGGRVIAAIERRAKYLLWHDGAGVSIVHLGMSGSLRVIDPKIPKRPHDHVEWILDNGLAVRLHDPRRFGCVLWTADVEGHALLNSLGPEPLGNEFHAEWLHQRSRGRKQAVKTFIMDAKQVVGVGNIYASEALYRAGIHPGRAAGRVSLRRYEALVTAIRTVLTEAIESGGTTLRDFLRDSGEPGYFKQSLNVYGRHDEPCKHCGKPIRIRQIGQRSSFFCTSCQR